MCTCKGMLILIQKPQNQIIGWIEIIVCMKERTNAAQQMSRC